MDDAALIEGLRAGDENVFETLVRTYGGRLLAVARRVLRNDEDARDAVQDAFINAFRHRASFKGDALERDVRETFEAHLKACPDCHTYLAQYRETIRAGQLACKDEDVSELPEDLVQAVLAAISREPRS